MSATLTTCLKVGGASYKYTWTGTDYPYRIMVSGKLLVSELTANEYIIEGDDALEPDWIEVLGDSDLDADSLSYLYPTYATIQWRGAASASYYLVQQYISSVWTTIASVAETGFGYYRYDFEATTDTDAPLYQVIAYSGLGVAGTALPFDFYMSGIPEPPSIAITYTPGTHTFTVAAR